MSDQTTIEIDRKDYYVTVRGSAARTKETPEAYAQADSSRSWWHRPEGRRST